MASWFPAWTKLLCEASMLGTNKQGMLSCLTLHLDQNDPDQLSDSQFIWVEMRMCVSFLLEMIPQDILKCAEPTGEKLHFLVKVTNLPGSACPTVSVHVIT